MQEQEVSTIHRHLCYAASKKHESSKTHLWLDEDVDGHECADEAEGGHGGEDDALHVEEEPVRGGVDRHHGSDQVELLQGKKSS